MIDREMQEKVIRGLEYIEDAAYSWHVNGKTLGKPTEEIENICHQAIILLQAQEPRVLTLDEVKALPTDDGENAPVWVETRIVTDKGVLAYLEASLLWVVEDNWWRRFGPIHSGWEDRKADTYGVTWRCWSARPTDERRETEPWD